VVSPLWDDPLDIVVSSDHPLAKRRQTLLEDLLKEDAVLPGARTYTRGILDAALGEYRPRLKVAMETNFLETLRMLATAGLGWTLLPRTMNGGDLHVLRLRGLKLSRLLGVVTHRQRTLSNAARAMIFACETLSEIP
jgi:DNA-binding transcriptional LysR family regulator